LGEPVGNILSVRQWSDTTGITGTFAPNSGFAIQARKAAKCRGGSRFATAKKGEIAMARKYSTGASKKVEKAMHERKRGTLKSGQSGKTVKSRKQAIAIGLSEARREGKKVPKRKSSSKSSGKSRSGSSK
jgi:hypothetical protein